MSSSDPAIAILPINLGTAAAFDQRVFPLTYYEDRGDNLSKGSFLIKATLEEMEKIKQLRIDLNKNEDFIFNTRLNLEVLKAQKAKIQDNRKTLNPFKAFLNYRAARMFHAASRTLYLETKRTSEKIHREEENMQVVPTTQIRAVNDAVSPNAELGGWAVELPNGLDDDARRTLNDLREILATGDPFGDDALISQLHDDEQAITLVDTSSFLSQDNAEEGNSTPSGSNDLQRSRPTSPQTINHIHYNFIQNSIVAANSSNLNGLTTNSSSQQNSGASVAQELAP